MLYKDINYLPDRGDWNFVYYNSSLSLFVPEYSSAYTEVTTWSKSEYGSRTVPALVY